MPAVAGARAGKGALFDISPGVVLTLSAQPQHWDRDGGMFKGAGRDFC